VSEDGRSQDGPLSVGPSDARLPKRRPLTNRETDVLKLVAEGYTNIQIGLHLSISVRTVEAHRTRIMWKLNLHSVVELVHYAVRAGIVKPYNQ
jgi:DNA-binding NarL/FixJ family response regulator